MLVLHDDIAISTGPAFNPAWYEEYLYPKYKELLKPIKAQGKKALFTTDGNSALLIGDLMACGFDGFEIECPATNLEEVLKKCGHTHTVIGGIDKNILSFGTPDEVYEHAKRILSLGRNYPGFIVSNAGGIHGNVKLRNIEAYNAAVAQMRNR